MVLDLGWSGALATSDDHIWMYMHFHALSTLVLKLELNAQQAVSGPVDLLLMLSSFMPNGQWNPDPNVVTQICSAWQYILHSISLRDCWLLSNKQSTTYQAVFAPCQQ